MLRAFVKDSVIYAIPTFITRGLSLLLVPLYTRVLSPADYGSLDLLMVFASLVNLTVAMEVSQGVARFYASEQDSARKVAYASSALWFTIGSYTLFAILASCFSGTLASWIMGREGLGAPFQVGVAYIWLHGIFCLMQNQFRWELRSKHYAAVSLLVSLITASVAVWLTYGLRWGLKGLLWGMVIGVAAGVVFGIWHLRQSFGFVFDKKRLKEMLFFSAPLVPSGIAVFISTYIDRMMINHYLTVDDVGLYGIGFRLSGVVNLVMVGFRGALTPLVYTYHRETDTPLQLARIFRVFLAFALLLYLCLTLFSYDILVLMTTPKYYSASQVVMFLVPAILLSQMYIFAPGIGIAKKTHLIFWINICGATLNVFLNWWLIPFWGIRGAALATLVGSSCVFGAYMVFSQRLYSIPHDWRRILIALILIVSLGAAILSLDLSGIVRWSAHATGLLVAVLLLLATGLLRFSEVVRFSQLVFERFRVLISPKSS